MLKKSAAAFIACLALANCSSDQPRVIQTAAASPEVIVKSGMATQIEMPDGARVQSVTVGNSALLTADKDADIVNLSAKDGAGETNLIVRARDTDGHIKVYQYHVVIQAD